MNNDKKIEWILISLFIIFIVGTAGLYFYQKNRYKGVYFDYNGFTVHKVADKTGNSIFQTRIFVQGNEKPYAITTRYSPQDLEDIPVKYSNKDILKEQIYITMPPTATSMSVLAATEISKITGNMFLYKIPTQGALTAAVEGKNTPVKTCSDVSDKQAIIYLKQAEELKISSQNGCVILEAPTESDLVKVANRLTFTLLGIMEK